MNTIFSRLTTSISKSVCRGASRRENGFTLLEVMLAVMIFATVCVSFAVLLNRTIQTAALERRSTEVRLGLESRLAELKQQLPQPLVPSPAWEKMETDDTGIIYERRILLANLKSNKNKPLLNLYNLSVRAKWRYGTKEEITSADMLVYQP